MAQLLTPTEVAHRLNVSRKHVHNLIASGVLPSVKVSPRVVRIRPEHVRALEGAATPRQAAVDAVVYALGATPHNMDVVTPAFDDDTVRYLLDNAISKAPQSAELDAAAAALRVQLCS